MPFTSAMALITIQLPRDPPARASAASNAARMAFAVKTSCRPRGSSLWGGFTISLDPKSFDISRQVGMLAPRMLERLAHVIVRRRWWVIAAWIVLTFVGAFSAGQLSKRWFQSFSIPGYSGYETNQKTLKLFKSGEYPPMIAVFHTNGDITKVVAAQKA